MKLTVGTKITWLGFWGSGANEGQTSFVGEVIVEANEHGYFEACGSARGSTAKYKFVLSENDKSIRVLEEAKEVEEGTPTLFIPQEPKVGLNIKFHAWVNHRFLHYIGEIVQVQENGVIRVSAKPMRKKEPLAIMTITKDDIDEYIIDRKSIPKGGGGKP